MLAEIIEAVGEAQFRAWQQELAGELDFDPGAVTAAPGAEEDDQAEGMTLDEAADRIANDAVFVLTQGNPTQRGQLWEGLGQLLAQARGVPALAGLAAFVDAVRQLLEGRTSLSPALEPPFAAAWQRIQEGLGGGL